VAAREAALKKRKEKKRKEKKRKEKKRKEKKRKEKTTPFGINLVRSQVLYRAAQGLAALNSQTCHERALRREAHSWQGCKFNA